MSEIKTNKLSSLTGTNNDITIDPDGTGNTVIASGNVGIGTSPSQSLHVVGEGLFEKASADSVVSVSSTGGSGRSYQIRSQTSGDFYIYDNTAGSARVAIDGNGVFKVPYVYSDTNGSAANVHIGSDGRFYRSTSSRRYKNTIADATHGLTELLALRPVTYKGNNNGDLVFGGLIAEEVHDAGLTEFVEYNDDNEPDALAYANMVSLCIKAIQEQQATITALEARITALETE